MTTKTKCEKCGKEVYVFHSNRKNVDYYCDSDHYTDFHKCAKKQKVTTVAKSEHALKSADKLIVKNKPIVRQISLSRTVSYKYGQSTDYAKEKEEVLDSVTFGLELETEITADSELDLIVDRYASYVDSVIRQRFLKRIELKLIKTDDENE